MVLDIPVKVYGINTPYIYNMKSNAMMRPCSLLQVLLVLSHFRRVGANTIAGTETLVGIVGEDFVLLGADTSVSRSISLTASNVDKIAVLVDPFPKAETESSDTTQQMICAAAAGNSADCDLLLRNLRAKLAVAEFEAGIGCDVEVVNCDNSLGLAASYVSRPGMDVNSVAQLVRSLIVENLRRKPLQACLLVAGMSPRQNTLPSSMIQMTERLQQQVLTATAQLGPTTSPAQSDKEMSTSSQQDCKALEPTLYWLDEYGANQKIEYGTHGYGSALILSILDQRYRSGMSRQEAIELMRTCFDQLRTRYTINSPNPPCMKCIDRNGCQLIR